ncbi:MAG: haloalkane dehalogenase [Bryobacteraceae bacterium]
MNKTAVCSSPAAGTKLPPPVINEEFVLPRKRVEVLGSGMSYVESGAGEPVVFVHGNPTSAYLWRNIIPHVFTRHRAIALDLIGMGESGKPDIGYRFEDHYRYLEAFVAALGLDSITFVLHDWGGALGWAYAMRNPARVKRIAFMEAVLPPRLPMQYSDFGPAEAIFRGFRTPGQGEQMVLEENLFVERVLPGSVNRTLGETARAAYRAPYCDKAHRLPTLVWPRELPVEGAPGANVALMREIGQFMKSTAMPVLAIYAEPGVLMPRASVDWYVANMHNVETAFVGQGLHYIQEDQPQAIGRALADWMRRN